MSTVKLKCQGPSTVPSRMFKCQVGVGSYMVVPRGMYNKKEQGGIPVAIEGVPYFIATVYSTFTRDYEMFLYAAEGPYQGFKGPQVLQQEIEVSLETFQAHFNFCAWYRSTKGGVMAVQYPTDQTDAVAHAIERGYSFIPLLPLEALTHDD